jgi:hypothetical protein
MRRSNRRQQTDHAMNGRWVFNAPSRVSPLLSVSFAAWGAAAMASERY